MEMELGLKITKTRDDSTSISEYRLAKDTTGPVFQSRETNTMFILTAHLKGYKRNNIHIKISEDGSKISISGEKPIQEMWVMGWIVFKKDVEITSFSKVFKIPDGVNLDWIKAKYDEEECILTIVMPKSVKGICGAMIEEVKEDESDRGRSELERGEDDHILKSSGETSKKGTKESEVQEMKYDGHFVEKEEVSSGKMLDDDSIVERTKGTIKDGGETSVRKKVDKVEHEAMKTSETEKNVGTSIPQNTGDASEHKKFEIQETEDIEDFVERNEGRESGKMLNDTNGGIIGETIQQEIEDGNGASVREKGGKEAMKTSENVGAAIPCNIGDTSHDRESEVQEMEDNGTYGRNVEKKEKMASDKMLDVAKGNMIGEMIKKEIQESKLGIEGGEGENVRENDGKAECEAIEQEKNVKARIPLSIGDPSKELSKERVAQLTQEAESAVEEVDRQEDEKMLAKAHVFSQEDAYGDSKQKDFEQTKSDIEDINKGSVEEVISMEKFQEIKTSELDQDLVADHILSSNIGGMDQEKESEECGIQKRKKTLSVEANNAIQENIFGKPNETANGDDEECQKEKADKERFEPVTTLREEFPNAPQVGKGKNVSKMKESREVAEAAIVKTKSKEIEYSVEKGEGGEPKGMHVETSTPIEKDITDETQKEIEKPKSGIKDSDQQGGFEVLDSITEDLPKQEGEKLNDGRKRFKDEKMEEPKKVIREAKVEGEISKQTTEIESRAAIKTTETLQKEDEEFDVERKAKEGSSNVPDIIARGDLGVMGAIQVKVPEKVEEAMAVDEDDKTEYGIVKLKGEGYIRINFEANKDFEEDITRERLEKEIREPKLKYSDQLGVEENIDNGGVDGSKIQELPAVGETEDGREEGAKTDQPVKKISTEKYEKTLVVANDDFGKDITRETVHKEMKDPTIQTEERDQCLQEKIGEGKTDEAIMASKEEFPLKIVDSLADKRERVKDTKIEEAKELVKQESEEKVGEAEDIKDHPETEQSQEKVKEERYEKIQVETNGGKMKDITRETSQKETEQPEIQNKEKDQQCLPEEMSKRRPEVSNAAQEEVVVKRIDSLERDRLKEKMPGKEERKEELVKQQNEEQMEETEDVKDKGAEKEQLVKKENGEKYEHIQVEASGGMSKDIIREMTQKETKKPETQTDNKDQQCLRDAMSEGRFEASTTEREFPLQIIDSQAKRGDGQKDEKMEATEKVKQELAKRKNKEEKLVESTTREKIQVSDGERITKTLQEVAKEEHPKALDTELDERELQPEERPTEHAKVLRMGYKELEQGSAKEAEEEGGQYNYNTQSTKAVAAKDDQVTKPRFPPTQQFEVGEGKLQEGCKEKYKSQKEYHTKDLQDSTEMKDQESQHTEVLKLEVPLDELLKKREQDTGKDEFQEGQKFDETMQEEAKQSKIQIDGRDQQYVQGDVGREVGTVEVIQREMPKEEYASNATLEIEKDMSENVNYEKFRVKEEIKKTGSGETQEKEHQRKSKAVEKEEPLESISSLPRLTSIDVKNGKPKPHRKDLSPLILTAETKSKEPSEFEQSIAEWGKLPETKEYVPESRDRKQNGYGTEDIKAPKSLTCKGAKSSEDEENRKSENVVEELPRRNTDTGFQKSIEWGAPIENEYIETFGGDMLENQGLGEKQEVSGQEVAPGERDNQERNKEGYNGPKISTGDRGQQYVQEDNDKKVYQATKAVNEELSSREHKEEKIVPEKREVPTVEKSEEPKDSSKQLPKTEKVEESTQVAEDKMPEQNEINPRFEEASEFKQDAGRIQEPATTIVITPKKGMPESDREEMPHLPTEIQRNEPCELSWSSMSTQQYQLEEKDKREASDEVRNQDSRKEYTRTNVQCSNNSETDQEVEQVETPQPNSYKDQLSIYKDEEEIEGKYEAVGEKARKLKEEEECEVIIVEKEEAIGGNKVKTRKTKKLFAPLVAAGSTLLVSLVFIVIHRSRARKRSN